MTIHDLRRSGATLLTENGFDRDVIEKALSHERKGTRAVYISQNMPSVSGRCCSSGPITSSSC
jgi:integrase